MQIYVVNVGHSMFHFLDRKQIDKKALSHLIWLLAQFWNRTQGQLLLKSIWTFEFIYEVFEYLIEVS